jgi:hypothetical protein
LGGRGFGEKGLGNQGFGNQGFGNQGFGKHGLGLKGLSDKGLGDRELGDPKAQSLAGARGGRSDDVAQEGDGGEKGAVRSNGRSASDVESEGGCPLRSEKVVQTGMVQGIEKGERDAAPFQRPSELNADGSMTKNSDQEGLVDSVKGGPRAFESASESAFSFLWDDDKLRTRLDLPILIFETESTSLLVVLGGQLEIVPKFHHCPHNDTILVVRSMRQLEVVAYLPEPRFKDAAYASALPRKVRSKQARAVVDLSGHSDQTRKGIE